MAEFTQFGWGIMSPGVQPNLDNMFLAQTAQSDYEELCRMDVLGIQDTPSGDQKVVHEEFLEQLRRDPVHGWYEIGHPPLPSNEENSLKRLGTLVQRLKKTDKFDEYNSIFQDQLLLNLQMSHQLELCSIYLIIRSCVNHQNPQKRE